jgi:hypothetical protein
MLVSAQQQKVLEGRYGCGYVMVAATGWLPEQPLGVTCKGIATPIMPKWRHNSDKSGLGYEPGKEQVSSTLGGGKPKHLKTERVADTDSPPIAVFNANFLQHMAEETKDNQSARVSGGHVDIWEDKPVLQYLRTGTMAADATPHERKRVISRAKGYTCEKESGKLLKIMAGSKELRVVPPPDERVAVVQSTHETCGHFGVKRTLHLVMHGHWWQGMLQDVRSVVGRCVACDRVKTHFNVRSPELQPLEIAGMFYRWGVDLFGPLPTSESGYDYVMICVEYFSKHVEAIPLKDKYSSTTAKAFLSNVIARFGACAEVVTDGGREFQGEFAQLLEQCFIDHRVTSPNHPQADGLAERCVQTFKAALRKVTLVAGTQAKWDEALPWILLGYRCSKQAAIGFSPYHMLYARAPTIPPAAMQLLDPALDLDKPEAAAKSILLRAELLKRLVPMAADNHRIAQHRDTQRYATLRGGGHMPKLRKFEAGDFVYLRQGSNTNTLMPKAKQNIYRVVEVRPSGNLILMGKCGRTITNNVINCAPCHLPDIDPTVDHRLARPDAAHACENCLQPDDEAKMLLCDACGAGYHIYCLQPPLAAIPKDPVWICPPCVTGGITRAALEKSWELAGKGVPEEDAPEEGAGPVLTTAQRDLRAQRHHGRVVCVKSTKKGQPVEKWGTLEFVGVDRRPRYFDIKYQDGTVERAVTWKFVYNKIIPEGGKMPDSAGQAAPVVSAACVCPPLDWPHTWQLCNRDRSTAYVLGLLMPGQWAREDVRRVSRCVPGGLTWQQLQGASVPDARVTAAEVGALLEVLDFVSVYGVLEPWADGDGVYRAFAERGMHAWTCNAVEGSGAHFCMDPVQPGTYRALKERGVCLEAIVSSPWFSVLDVALPLAVRYASVVACVRVPMHYVSNAPEARRRWLNALLEQGRLLLITGIPASLTGQVYTWLVVFSGQLARRRMLRGSYAQAGDQVSLDHDREMQ